MCFTVTIEIKQKNKSVSVNFLDIHTSFYDAPTYEISWQNF